MRKDGVDQRCGMSVKGEGLSCSVRELKQHPEMVWSPGGSGRQKLDSEDI